MRIAPAVGDYHYSGCTFVDNEVLYEKQPVHMEFCNIVLSVQCKNHLQKVRVFSVTQQRITVT